jgi:N-acetylglucosamine kinase-like BadF-type ATPase
MRIYLGVDAGASKTFALAANASGRVIGFGQAGCGNHQSAGPAPALQEIAAACRQALGQQRASYASFCLAGADLPPDFAMLRPALAALDLAATLDLRNDAWAAMRAGTTSHWGAVVICGSGINAAVRAPDGREFILPSLGALSGDWGGGSAIATAGLGAVARAWDGRGPATALTGLVLRQFGEPHYEALIESLYTEHIPRRSTRVVAPLVFQAALDGDQVAQAIIVRAGSEIGHTAGTLLTRLGLQCEPCEVVTGGSVFKGVGPLLLDAATLALHRLAPRAAFTRALIEPVVGALLLAIEQHRQPITPPMLARLRATLPEQLVIRS